MSKGNTKNYNSDYFKRRYSTDKVYRERHIANSMKWQNKKKRKNYKIAVEYIVKLLKANDDIDSLIDKLMAEYKIIKRK